MPRPSLGMDRLLPEQVIELRQIHVPEIIHLRELRINGRQYVPVDLPDCSAQSPPYLMRRRIGLPVKSKAGDRIELPDRGETGRQSCQRRMNSA